MHYMIYASVYPTHIYFKIHFFFFFLTKRSLQCIWVHFITTSLFIIPLTSLLLNFIFLRVDTHAHTHFVEKQVGGQIGNQIIQPVPLGLWSGKHIIQSFPAENDQVSTSSNHIPQDMTRYPNHPIRPRRVPIRKTTQLGDSSTP